MAVDLSLCEIGLVENPAWIKYHVELVAGDSSKLREGPSWWNPFTPHKLDLSLLFSTKTIHPMPKLDILTRWRYFLPILCAFWCDSLTATPLPVPRSLQGLENTAPSPLGRRLRVPGYQTVSLLKRPTNTLVDECHVWKHMYCHVLLSAVAACPWKLSGCIPSWWLWKDGGFRWALLLSCHHA